MLWILVLLCIFVQNSSPEIIRKVLEDVSYQMVGIFEGEGETQAYAFNESIRHAHIDGIRLEPKIFQPLSSDSFSVWKELCSDRSIRPIAIFGPQNPLTDGAVRHQSFLANIPHIQATSFPYDPDLNPLKSSDEEEFLEDVHNNEAEEEVTEDDKKTTDVNEEPVYKPVSINFYPEANEISLAYAKLLKHYGWESFAVLYEDDFGLLRIQKILAECTDQFPVVVRKLDPNSDNKIIFKELAKLQESRILLDCHADRLLKHLKEAEHLKMVNHYQHYVLITLDASRFANDLLAFKSNITWLSLTRYESLKNPQHFLAQRVNNWIPSIESPKVTDMEVESLIMDDIANHVIKAFQGITNSNDIETPPSSPCDTETGVWSIGAKFQNELLKTQTLGITGNIVFDEITGKRINYTLYVNEKLIGLQTIGRWESYNNDSIIIDGPISNGTEDHKTSKHFIVISRKYKPYFYEKTICDPNDETCEEETADEKYEGFTVDLVKAIFDILKSEKFNYTYSFELPDDTDYGKYDPVERKWNGLIGKLLNKEADLAVCDLTITEERKKVVDFSVPFMSLGISILYTKERKVMPGLFSFLNPYTFDVWMYTATAYCVVSIVLFICARISPADWENPQPCDKDPEELENIWNFKNCTWLTMGSIMTQGCDILPKAIGTRWICGMWWFFAVIVCQTYIAQLSASMTSAMENEPINSVEDLAKQTKIRYGAIKGGSTLEFFRRSKDKMYRKMYENMMANPTVLAKTNDEGEKRVLNSKNKYAFFMESCTIEYKLKRHCDLKQVGMNLDAKDYGIAMPANSPFRTDINRAILRLKQLTKLEEIKDKWWNRKYGAIHCEDEETIDQNENDLEMKNLIGAFLVLIVGLVFCLFITAAEFMNEVRNIVVREQVSHKEVFIQELKASLNFFQLEKPVLRNPSRAPSLASTLKSEEKCENRALAIENFLDFEKDVQ